MTLEGVYSLLMNPFLLLKYGYQTQRVKSVRLGRIRKKGVDRIFCNIQITRLIDLRIRFKEINEFRFAQIIKKDQIETKVHGQLKCNPARVKTVIE